MKFSMPRSDWFVSHQVAILMAYRMYNGGLFSVGVHRFSRAEWSCSDLLRNKIKMGLVQIKSYQAKVVVMNENECSYFIVSSLL